MQYRAAKSFIYTVHRYQQNHIKEPRLHFKQNEQNHTHQWPHFWKESKKQYLGCFHVKMMKHKQIQFKLLFKTYIKKKWTLKLDLLAGHNRKDIEESRDALVEGCSGPKYLLGHGNHAANRVVLGSAFDSFQNHWPQLVKVHLRAVKPCVHNASNQVPRNILPWSFP